MCCWEKHSSFSPWLWTYRALPKCPKPVSTCYRNSEAFGKKVWYKQNKQTNVLLKIGQQSCTCLIHQKQPLVNGWSEALQAQCGWCGLSLQGVLQGGTAQHSAVWHSPGGIHGALSVTKLGVVRRAPTAGGPAHLWLQIRALWKHHATPKLPDHRASQVKLWTGCCPAQQLRCGRWKTF